MRIDVLQEYEFPEIQTKIVKSLPDQYNKQYKIHGDTVGKTPGVMKRSKDVKHLGTGSYASAYSHKDRPADVRKISGQRPTFGSLADEFWYWIQFLSKDKNNDNPYFPRFREITVYRKEDEMVYSLQMERLQPLEKLSSEQIQSVFHKIWGENIDKALAVASLPGFNAPNPDYDAHHLAALVKKGVTNSAVWELAIDEEFKQAATTLKAFINWREDAYLDLHHQNIMVRMTPYGAHLVISDPVA